MADFSDLAGPTSEWDTFAKKAGLGPNPTPASDHEIPAIRASIMKQRLKTKELELSRLGDHGVSHITITILSHDQLDLVGRVYRPASTSVPNAVLLFLHGGGFLAGTPSTEEATCTRLAKETGLVVVHVGYRLIPEWKSPTQLEDAWSARCWVLDNFHVLGLQSPPDLYVLGISAGAYLAAGLVIRERMELQQSTIKGQCLYVPWLCLPHNFPTERFAPGKSSAEQCRDAPLLPSTWIEKYTAMLDTPDELKDDVLHNPLLFKNDVGRALPPTHIMVCGNDPLRDEGILFKNKLDALGIPTKFDAFPGLPHYFRRFPDAPGNKEWDDNMTKGVKWLRAIATLNS